MHVPVICTFCFYIFIFMETLHSRMGAHQYTRVCDKLNIYYSFTGITKKAASKKTLPVKSTYSLTNHHKRPYCDIKCRL